MSKKQKPAGHPGVGKSKIMKKLAKKLKRKYVDASEWRRWAIPNVEINPVVMEWLGRLPSAMAALRDDQLKNPYIFDPSVKTEPVQPRPIQFCTNNRPEDGVGDGPLRKHIFADANATPGMVEHMDALVTFWDGQLDDMSGGFHLLRDRLVNAEDHATLKLVDELLHRVIEVRCQLNTMKKEQSQ